MASTFKSDYITSGKKKNLLKIFLFAILEFEFIAHIFFKIRKKIA
jgi:hypothetical protein